MNPLHLQIDRWAAWAPGLETSEAWVEWLRAPQPVTAEGVPALSEMPAMMRRRIEPLGRVALQAAYWAQGDAPTGPVVLASRWGEIERSVGMLEQLAAGESLSPTAFSLSVHNAVGALFSIARKDKNNYQAVAAGEFSAEAGFAEAAGLLADGAPQVLVVYFDAPLPEAYAAFEQQASFPHAFACLLSRAESGGISLGSELSQASRPSPADGLPPGLQVLNFLLGDATQLRRHNWLWQRHAV
ncbi:MAG TPA: beta-ketoacyl synthase chain length factor [Burkholderiaceae bacterium]|jgi:hypothetical protein